jgi:D-alanine-D-alanine ligase
MKGNSIAGYGIYATRLINVGEIIYRGEERAHRIVTKKHVEENWNDEEKMNFKRYAYPISDTVFAIWDEEPGDWAPQNHSCDPNTRFDGLNTIAIRTINIGEELTFDYATFLDREMEPFECRCGSPKCRGLIKAN